MAEEKSVASASAVTVNEAAPQTKAELQQRMEEARESLAQTVEEIKETVTDQYEAVKETVTDVLDWREQFKENPLVWGAGAVAAGLVVGYSIALARQGEHTSRRKRSSNESVTDSLFDEISTVGQNILLPAINGKVKELFGIDLSAHLFPQPHAEPATRTRKSVAKKSAARKKSVKKTSKKSTRKSGAS